jgi:hypothetical protein
MDNIEQAVITEEDIRTQQAQLAQRKGLTVGQLYARLDAGAYHGSILESKLTMLRFMLGDDAPAAAAE